MMAVLGSFRSLGIVNALVDNLGRNILKERKLRQQVNDSVGVVQNPPAALPERPRSPFFKRNKDQPMPCAADNSSIVSYMHKWQVEEYSVSMMTYLILTI